MAATAVPMAVPMALPMGVPANVVNNINVTTVYNVQQNGYFVSMLDKVHPFLSCCCGYVALTPSFSTTCQCQLGCCNWLCGCCREAEEGFICCEDKCVTRK